MTQPPISTEAPAPDAPAPIEATTEARLLFDAAAIAGRVEALAHEIVATMPPDLTVVGMLKGSFLFTADLVRALGRLGALPRVEFMRVSSYGSGKQSSGIVQCIGPLPGGVAGRHVLLVDDIIDSGRSLTRARDLLQAEGTAAIRSCVLLDKPSRREVPIAADHVGFTIPDLFVVGYGIDYAEGFRYLPWIGVVD